MDKNCICDPETHPQTPPKKGPSFHKCGVCGTVWEYGVASPTCTGPIKPEGYDERAADDEYGYDEADLAYDMAMQEWLAA